MKISMIIQRTCFLLLSISILGSCKKVLDVAPYDSLTDATAFETPARIDLAMNGVYDAAQSGFYAGSYVNNRGYPFGSASIQQGDMRGEDMATQQTFYQITNEATYNATTANNVNMWGNLYGLINKANLTIEGLAVAVSKGIITSAVGAQYTAECRFLRAMALHEAVVNFARPYADGNGNKLGVVIREFGINSDATVAAAKAIPRSTVAECYTKILADLDFAEQNLSATKNTFRATKSAAIALKMRVKLHMQDWAGVITEGAKLVTQSNNPGPAPDYKRYKSQYGDSLMTSVTAPFGTAVAPVASTPENVFSIKNDPTDNPGTNAALARMWGRPSSRGVCVISPIIYNLTTWRCDDQRRTSTLIAQSGQYYYTAKYIDYTNWSDAAPMIRYAEVILILAEAEARNATGTTVSAKGLDLLNFVRNRAVPSSAYYTTFANKNALIKAILEERRIEFLAEGKRWGDIHRLALDPDFNTGGIPAKMSAISGTDLTLASYNCAGGITLVKGIPAIAYSDIRFIWPIPLDEVQQNPIVIQNPGYQ
jgi:hypothetical protein